MKRRLFRRLGIGFAVIVSILIVLFLAILAVYALTINAPAAGQINGELVSSGLTRRYVLHVPETYDPSVPAPLIVSLHGFAEWPAHQMEISRWNDLADRNGFLVVYPAGTGFPLRWNAGNGANVSPLTNQDVAFINDLIDTIETRYNVDPSRIFANGLSNGGGMAYALACVLSGRVAAVGGVSGAYLYPPEECKPSRPVPFIAFHGTADPIVPYGGGPSGFDYPFPAITDFIAGWAARNSCTPSPEALPASGDVTGVHYGQCDQNADVVFYTIRGGGHAWPGGGALPEIIVGRTTQDIDATLVMWNFFMDHPLR
jgi:polyhydroxybutyrate depolymerase